MEFIYKKSCFYSYLFKLQSSSNYSPFDAIHLSRCFFHCSKQFLNLSILMAFSASDRYFFFTSYTLAKCFPLRTFFIWGNTEKSLGVRSGEKGGWGRGIMPFGQKLLNTRCNVGRCACKSCIMKWAKELNILKKKCTEVKCSLSQQRQLVH